MIGMCVNCGDIGEMELAHVIPKSMGGVGTVPLCPPCHALQHTLRDRQSISDLTREGLSRASADGVRLGRPQQYPDEVVTRILSERSARRSLRTIADGLTRDGIPTARGGVAWQPSTIQAVLRSQRAAELSALA